MMLPCKHISLVSSKYAMSPFADHARVRVALVHMRGRVCQKNVKLQTLIVGGYPERSIDRACIDADDACAYAWLTGYDPALADEERGVLAEKAHSWAPEERDKIRGGPPRPNEIVPYGIKGNC